MRKDIAREGLESIVPTLEDLESFVRQAGARVHPVGFGGGDHRVAGAGEVRADQGSRRAQVIRPHLRYHLEC